jgi:Fe-S-cluster containining protein
MSEPIFEAARETMAKGLAAQRTPANTIELIRKFELTLDREVQANRSSQGAPIIACKAGCSYCCHEVVVATVPDLVRAEAYVREHYAGRDLESLKQRLYAYERAVAPCFGFNLGRVRTTCPFLEEGLCGIYEARPMRCRAVHSMDAEPCKRIEHGESPTIRPEVKGEPEINDAAYRGVNAGMAQVGLSTGALDFGRAMAIAVEDPSAISRLFLGENQFTPAVSRQPTPVLPKVARTTLYHRYAPGEEPTGKIGVGDLALHYERYNENDLNGAIAALSTNHPVGLIRQILVPTLYRTEDEVRYWRGRCREAILALGEAQYDPREAFDSLQALSTFEIAYQQENDREILSLLGQTLVDKITAKALPHLVEPIVRKPRTGKLKVGYISENLTLSNGGSWARGWLKNHGPEIERYAFCLSDNPDAVTSRFAQLANHFFLMNQEVPAQARFIKSLGLDVLIYPDIGISGRNYQYATMRLAPVQCTAWGHPVTSGLPTIDFYLSSDLMEPANGQDHYREQLVRLPGSGLTYPRRLFPPSRMTKADFGLDDGLLYLSCQNPMKYLPRWDHLYAEICLRTKRPIVFVEGPKAMDKEILKERMKKAGVNAKWLPNLSMSDFFALVKIADVCLDTPGWNGGNTTIQALQENVPVATLPGEFMRGRHGLAFCEIANVSGLIASSEEDFVDLVCDQARLKAAMSDVEPEALFEDTRPAKALDEFLLGLL